VIVILTLCSRLFRVPCLVLRIKLFD
jgi:hypothetical protein